MTVGPVRLVLVRADPRVAVATVAHALERVSEAEWFAHAVSLVRGREADWVLVAGPPAAVSAWRGAEPPTSRTPHDHAAGGAVELIAVSRERIATRLACDGRLALAGVVRRWREAPHAEGVVQLLLYAEDPGAVAMALVDVQALDS